MHHAGSIGLSNAMGAMRASAAPLPTAGGGKVAAQEAFRQTFENNFGVQQRQDQPSPGQDGAKQTSATLEGEMSKQDVIVTRDQEGCIDSQQTSLITPAAKEAVPTKPQDAMAVQAKTTKPDTSVETAQQKTKTKVKASDAAQCHAEGDGKSAVAENIAATPVNVLQAVSGAPTESSKEGASALALSQSEDPGAQARVTGAKQQVAAPAVPQAKANKREGSRIAGADATAQVSDAGRVGAPAGTIGTYEAAAVMVSAGAGEVLSAPGVLPGHAAHSLVSGASSASPAQGKQAEPAPSAAASVAASSNTDMKTLVATPKVLEVGMASGTHGWLRVRAELGQTGEVVASVAASSVSAAEGLHKELPAISAYLAGEKVGVSSLNVNANEKSGATQDAQLEMGRDGQDQAQQGRGARSQTMPQQGGSRAYSMEAEDFGSVGAFALPAAVFANGSGSWLSVRV